MFGLALSALWAGASWFIKKSAPTVGGAITQWIDYRTKLRDATLDLKLKEIEAKTELAVYRIKADTEWDLKWADAAQHSWKDEYLLILWSLPLIGIFIPFFRPFVEQGFDYLRMLSPDGVSWYFTGWGVIFAATFGLKAAASFMAPGNVRAAINAMANSDDDIPDEVADTVAEDMSDRLKKARSRNRT